jgi:hypothetical protein
VEKALGEKTKEVCPKERPVKRSITVNNEKRDKPKMPHKEDKQRNDTKSLFRSKPDRRSHI